MYTDNDSKFGKLAVCGDDGVVENSPEKLNLLLMSNSQSVDLLSITDNNCLSMDTSIIAKRESVGKLFSIFVIVSGVNVLLPTMHKDSNECS